MKNAQSESWLKLLEAACKNVDIPYLDLIIDQTGCQNSLIPSVLDVHPPLRWCSLFDDLPEAGLKDIAPLLVRVDLNNPLQRHWLSGLIREFETHSILLALISAWRFEALAGHLGQCLEASNGGKLMLFRYYDPRLFPLLFSDVLQPEQQQPWLRPAVLWSWLDRDGAAQQLPGSPDMPEKPECFSPVELSDSQLKILSCVSDATVAMGNLKAAFPTQWGIEQRFQACYAGMLDASETGLTSVAERKAFVLERLRIA